MILIYSKHITARLSYTLDFIFGKILKTDFKIADNKNALKLNNEPLINYSTDADIEGINILPQGLLFEDSIQDVELNTCKWDDINAFFGTSDSHEIPFDLFSASFYLLSRYEEYKLKIADKYNRFIGEESIAFKEGFYQKPIVDIWAYKLQQIILSKYPDYKFEKREFKFIPTIDIDNAWAYKHKGFVRTIGGMVRSVLKFQYLDLLNRLSVLVFKKKDPYDNYALIENMHNKYNLKPIYFFLIRNNGKYDTSHEIDNKYFVKLIKETSKKHEVGIHPSFTSNSRSAFIKDETSKLSTITNSKIIKSRNHFLKIKFPKTFCSLIKTGIEQDYSLGYNSLCGFRAGTCTPFKFFDLKKNVETELELIPFQIMDATLKYYAKVKPNEARKIIFDIIDEVKKVNGTFVSIWHNESFSNKSIWKNWLPVYVDLLKACAKS